MCISETLFEFILLGVNYTSWMFIFIHLIKFRKLSVVIFSNILSAFLCVFWLSHNMYVVLLVMSKRLLGLCLLFFKPFCFCDHLYNFISLSLLILSSACSDLPLNSSVSKNFYFSYYTFELQNFFFIFY